MAHRIDLATVGGVICAGLTLLLISPAHHVLERRAPSQPAAAVATAAETPAPQQAGGEPFSTAWLGAPPLPMPDPGPACQVDPKPAARAAAALASVRSQLEAQTRDVPSSKGGEFVVLNGRGYDYGPAPVSDPALLDFEARHIQH
jgi:hypothetical protein